MTLFLLEEYACAKAIESATVDTDACRNLEHQVARFDRRYRHGYSSIFRVCV